MRERNSDILCTRCKVRSAFYYKRASGEYLCRKCLFRGLERGIRRGLSNYSSMRREEQVIILDTFMPSIWLIPVIHLLHRVLREYKNYTIFLSYPWTLSLINEVGYDKRELSDEIIEISISRVSELISICSENYQYIEDLATCLMKMNLLISLENALERDIRYVAILCPRDRCFSLSLKNILFLNKEIVSEIYPKRLLLGVEVFNPLYDISEEDLLAYTISTGVYKRFSVALDTFIKETGLEKLIYSPNNVADIYSMINEIIYSGSREIIYSSTDALQKIYLKFRRCALCDAPLDKSDYGSICRFCRTLLPLFKSLNKILR
jgi:hypothetical protein